MKEGEHHDEIFRYVAAVSHFYRGAACFFDPVFGVQGQQQNPRVGRPALEKQKAKFIKQGRHAWPFFAVSVPFLFARRRFSEEGMEENSGKFSPKALLLL